jgi:hypothetical protein
VINQPTNSTTEQTATTKEKTLIEASSKTASSASAARPWVLGGMHQDKGMEVLDPVTTLSFEVANSDLAVEDP